MFPSARSSVTTRNGLTPRSQEGEPAHRPVLRLSGRKGSVPEERARAVLQRAWTTRRWSAAPTGLSPGVVRGARWSHVVAALDAAALSRGGDGDSADGLEHVLAVRYRRALESGRRCSSMYQLPAQGRVFRDAAAGINGTRPVISSDHAAPMLERACCRWRFARPRRARRRLCCSAAVPSSCRQATTTLAESVHTDVYDEPLVALLRVARAGCCTPCRTGFRTT